MHDFLSGWSLVDRWRTYLARYERSHEGGVRASARLNIREGIRNPEARMIEENIESRASAVRAANQQRYPFSICARSVAMLLRHTRHKDWCAQLASRQVLSKTTTTKLVRLMMDCRPSAAFDTMEGVSVHVFDQCYKKKGKPRGGLPPGCPPRRLPPGWRPQPPRSPQPAVRGREGGRGRAGAAGSGWPVPERVCKRMRERGGGSGRGREREREGERVSVIE